jgi:hypothetical protein
MSNVEYRSYEARIRRMAARQGLLLARSRLRDPYALGYGTYMLVDQDTRAVVASGLPGGYGLSLDDVDRELRQSSGPLISSAASA